jgi:hypothetical protein
VVHFQEAAILREFDNPVKEYLGTAPRPMTRSNSHEIHGDSAGGIDRKFAHSLSFD